MKKILATLFVLTTLLFVTSCGDSFKTYKVEDLYGNWRGEAWGFDFNKDGSAKIIRRGSEMSGEITWRAVSIGNTLEFVQDGKVIMANMTIKGIENDTLTIETRPLLGSGKSELATEIHKLARVE